MSKLIRVRDNTFKKLAVLGGKLQSKHKKFMTIDDTIFFLLSREEKQLKKFLEYVKNK